MTAILSAGLALQPVGAQPVAPSGGQPVGAQAVATNSGPPVGAQAVAAPAGQPAAALAQAGATTGGAAADSVRRFVEREAAAGGANGATAGLRVEVTVGELDPRLQLAPCGRIEPFIAPGARILGRTSVGLRCTQGATWSVLLPVTVRIFGNALVASRPLPAMQPVTTEDLHAAEVEWTRETTGLVIDRAQLDNQVLARPIAAGQPIPLAALRAQQVIGAGDPVTIQGSGSGFSVALDGVALNAASVGQAVRVRTESGRVIQGTARGQRRVEMAF
jgi:flagella basal body P-ring formation protein FlgA